MITWTLCPISLIPQKTHFCRFLLCLSTSFFPSILLWFNMSSFTFLKIRKLILNYFQRDQEPVLLFKKKKILKWCNSLASSPESSQTCTFTSFKAVPCETATRGAADPATSPRLTSLILSPRTSVLASFFLYLNKTCFCKKNQGVLSECYY